MAKTNNQRSNQQLQQRTYFVEGMHCPSCEIVIEKELLADQNIKSADVSFAQGRAVVFYQGRCPSLNELNQTFAKLGYTLFDQPVVKKKDLALVSFSPAGQLLINKSKLLRGVPLAGVVFLLLLVFIFLSQSGLASRVTVGSSSVWPAFFLFGLVAGTSSCAALVGGIVLAMSKQWAEIYQNSRSTWQRFQPHLLFNFGRLLSFALFGALLGRVGSFLQLSATVTAMLIIAVSVAMVLLALPMLGVGYFQRFQPSLPKFVARYLADESNFRGRHTPLTLGVLTFFLPCGFTITAQSLALASGSSLGGLLIMLAFALGTLPMLAAIGFSAVKLTVVPHWSNRFFKVAGAVVLFFGLTNLNSQLNVLGWASLTNLRISQPSPVRATTDGLAPLVNGKQLLAMDASAYGYQPNEFKVRVGVPVKWEIKNKGVSGCTNAIVSRGLFEGEIRLDQAVNVKEFIPPKAGDYKFSCWMGMVSGVIKVVALP